MLNTAIAISKLASTTIGEVWAWMEFFWSFASVMKAGHFLAVHHNVMTLAPHHPFTIALDLPARTVWCNSDERTRIASLNCDSCTLGRKKSRGLGDMTQEHCQLSAI